MASDPQKEKSGLEHTAQAAGAVKGAIKAGKALAGASKGAAFGPYGMAAGLAWEGRKVIAKVVIVLVALLLLPVMILMMLPSMLFGGLGGGDTAETVDDAVWDESIVEEALMNDYSVVTEHYEEACTAVDTVMRNAHADVLAEIHADFAGYACCCATIVWVYSAVFGSSRRHTFPGYWASYSRTTCQPDSAGIASSSSALLPLQASTSTFPGTTNTSRPCSSA